LGALRNNCCTGCTFILLVTSLPVQRMNLHKYKFPRLFCPTHLFLAAAVHVTCILSAQRDIDTTDAPARRRLLALPVVFYQPETGWGFGATALSLFELDHRDTLSPLSQVQFTFAYTTKGQMISEIPFHLYWNQRINTLSGEVSYNRFTYNFYGAGEIEPEGVVEKFKVRFPRMRLNYLRKLSAHIYAGARWWLEDYKMLETEDGGLLEQGTIPGAEGSTTSGPGIVALFDTRDNVYSSQKGFYLELVYHNQSRVWGSTYWFDRYRFDARLFLPTFKKQVLAINVFGDFLSGSVPFNLMASIGNSKRMRGFYDGRYRDKNLAMFQCEYRVKFGRVLGAALFLNSASLANNMKHLALNKAHYSGGAGLRLYLDERSGLSLRLDYAISERPGLFYFVVNEAF